MKELDNEINGYLKLNTESLTKQMNNAFEGKKAYEEKIEELERASKAKDERVKDILKKASQTVELDPILEEGNTGTEVMLYNPGMSLSE